MNKNSAQIGKANRVFTFRRNVFLFAIFFINDYEKTDFLFI